MILKTGQFNVSILSTSAPFRIFQQFGFQSGKDADKFAGCGYDVRYTSSFVMHNFFIFYLDKR
jgi:flavin reductase (DIM6/NTAB) family NADH-FMN oxidoreductase RutF